MRDAGNAGMRLENFAALAAERFRAAQPSGGKQTTLTLAETAALRLYTGPLFKVNAMPTGS